MDDPTISGLSQFGFAAVSAMYLLKLYTSSKNRGERDCKTRLDAVEKRLDEESKFVREKLLSLITTQGELIADCTATLKAVQALCTPLKESST